MDLNSQILTLLKVLVAYQLKMAGLANACHLIMCK